MDKKGTYGHSQLKDLWSALTTDLALTEEYAEQVLEIYNQDKKTQKLIDHLHEELQNIASLQYVSEQDWNEDAHVGKITLTIEDARLIYEIAGEL